MARRVLLWSLTIVLFTVIILCLPDVYLLPQQQDLFSEPLKLGYGHLSKHPDSMLLFISDRVSLWGGGGGGGGWPPWLWLVPPLPPWRWNSIINNIKALMTQ